MKWIANINNEVGYLENKDNYVSINEGLNETALRVKFQDTGKSIDDYNTFIVMGDHKETIDNMNSDLEIMEWFVKNTDGCWSDDVESGQMEAIDDTLSYEFDEDFTMNTNTEEGIG